MVFGDPAPVVEVLAAWPSHCARVEVPWHKDMTVREAVESSQLLNLHPELSLEKGRVGLSGHPCDPDTPVIPPDRVELYRPLIADPKDARRKRVEAARRAFVKQGGRSRWMPR